MADKFPDLDSSSGVVAENEFNETDFLKREAEVLGDEFKTDQDKDILTSNISNVDAATLENQQENTNNDVQNNASSNHDDDDDDDFGDFDQNTSTTATDTDTNTHEPSQALEQWKEVRDAEIKQKDETDKQAKDNLIKEATADIDQFYEDYSKKKQVKLDETAKEAEEFSKQKEQFFTQKDTTTWDRVLQLINTDDADVIGGRDRSKFKEILLKLKGNEKAPGASGY
ncbi:clathrin light chain CLC1 SCDLUD_004484 [Saccharomycodes ludwigii]|uniref:clathrin light chain CLC1 n=1 Tax=Saccharomycodes ludwigii TaxID=36035 RepID=UPI001E855E73|nr:hypothetical protein SCDLUD_004484 [Saccharomycodes ludwigii]KAH3899062.1 hypothetical protein SCDLUD_004484 [Saccharomycodes ludwigii]